MKIRIATLRDSRACAEIHMSARTAMAYLPRNLHTAEEIYFWKRNIVLPREKVWVAELGGKIVGYASVSDGLLNNLYVLPDCQGRGVGGALLSEVKTHAHEGVKLWTFEPNEGAIRFYERHGFVTVERSDGRTNEEKIPDRLMVWRPAPYAKER